MCRFLLAVLGVLVPLVSSASADPFGGWPGVPPVHPLPRTGMFSVTPSGAGYYSALDALLDVERTAPPKYPYPAFALIQQPFFDFKFAYLDDPKLADVERDPFDFLKRVHLGDCFLFGTGGQTWWRYAHEENSRLTGIDNVYDLWNLRAYADLWYRDSLRLYAEFITAQTFNHDLDPLPIDRNYSDFLDLFVEMKVLDVGGKKAYLRVGRQELLLGSQRLVSNLAWANTRRTFQGVRAYHVGEKWDFDAFWVQPVLPHPSRFDSVDNNVNFAGAWLTHRPKKGTSFDAYYLFLDSTNNITQRGITTAPFNVHTMGARAGGNEGRFLYDAELMFQLGERGSQTTVAGATAVGAGWNFQGVPFKPVFWACYDWASGDQSPNSGHYTTFNQLFPFGHYYFGWLDLVGRQNIHDVNAHLYLYPTPWITFWMQYHHFQLASSRDALYGAAGAALRRSPNGAAGHHVGDEFDFILNLHLDNHSDVQLGYCYLIGGRFIRDTATNAAQARDPSLFYAMYSFRW